MPLLAPLRSSDDTGPVLPRLGLALLVSVLAGLLVAGLAFPLIGAPALAAKSTADGFLELPAELTEEQLPTRSRILDARGGLLATLFLENRVNVGLGDVPAHVRNAVLAIEDSRFYQHNGVDTKGTLRAAVANSTSEEVQGGSTITQQYVKNALLNAARDEDAQKAAVERSLTRKLREARYALALEKQLTKDQILERYLNIAYFGNGAYGLGAAAQYYWGKRVQDLTLAQGAMLAGMVQNPSRFDPTDKEKAPDVVARRNTVLRRMAELALISEDTRAEGSGLPLAIDVHPVGNGCGDRNVGSAAFFCDYVRRELEGTDVGRALGRTREERQIRLLGGGLTIRTTLDRDVQRAAQEAVDERVPSDDDSGARAVADVVEPGTGHVKAMAVNQPYGEEPGQTKVNYAVGGTFGYQGGSTFKPFVLAAALQQGVSLNQTFDCPVEYTSKEFKNYEGGRVEPYTVRNAGDSEAGVFDLRTATTESVNTCYVQLEERTDVEPAARIAESLGLRWVRDPAGKTNGPLQRGGSFVLGGSEVSPLALAGAYAALAADGKFCRPQAVLSITDSRGDKLDVPEPACTQALPPEVASTLTDVLRGVISGPGPHTGGDAAIGRPAAGKTGTTNSSRAAWFIGYTPQLATAVWVGMPDPKTGSPRPMRDVRIGGRYYRQVYGGTIPAAVFRETMRAALRDAPVVDFDAPPPSAEQGATGVVPDLRGQSLRSARDALRAAGFDPADGGFADADYVDPGTVAYTVPGRGDPAPQGSTVTIFRANGRRG
ncbi:MAG: transglycosylase domain-containing protein [Actinomycetota bacterium]|nr:transglycosylase domain-containing protein [Actinomycetota bacterium]